ncbi:hypothetical protein PO604_18685, partial [Raoultella planticola]|uniref:hypothetical protein n=1 Tax=Raoultella planticola TaxID=575 RepID=UPI002FFA0848
SNNWYVKLPERALFPGGGVNALPGLQILRRYFAGRRDAYPGYRFCTGILPGGATPTRDTDSAPVFCRAPRRLPDLPSGIRPVGPRKRSAAGQHAIRPQVAQLSAARAGTISPTYCARLSYPRQR